MAKASSCAPRAGASRAPKGLLLSGSARSSATSTQMDAQQAAGQLKGAAQLVQHLTDAAAQSKAKPPARTDVLDQFAQRIQPEPPPADGTDATDRALKPFEAPALLMEAPASIALTTPHSTTVFAGQHLVASVQEDLHLAAQHTASFIAAKIKSLYTHAGGITAISANDPLSLRAHDDKLEVLADQSVTLTSSSDEVHVLAQSKIVLEAGQSSVTLEGGNITFACPGNFTVKGASKVLAGGGSAAAALRALPQAQSYVTAAEKDDPPSLVGRPAPVATEVRAISLDSPLDDGSANDGSGTNTQKGMVFGHTYAFSVKSYTNNAPSDLGTIKWKLRYTSPASSKNTQIEKFLVATGDKVEITIRDRDMCGCDVAIIAYIEDPDGGGSLTLFQHNRYRWFDSKKNDKQVEIGFAPVTPDTASPLS
ncbi:DUF2345 domain-containing protein [Niveibacterium sp. SC-1]|uniref:DUF2345 domain-containing protein n=2 Tax=Niveibacterium sp. SC-1 TaxID=3135646 RepID=UPI00311DCB32